VVRRHRAAFGAAASSAARIGLARSHLGRRQLFERSSAGLGAGTSEEEALRTALCEVLERDAVGRWEEGSALDKMMDTLDLDSVPLGWFQDWRERLNALGIGVRLFAINAVEGLPVFVCVIAGGEAFARRERPFSGSSAHGDPETALFKALAEALQSRLTFIAAARDDLLPHRYCDDEEPPGWSAALPVPPGYPQLRWGEIEPLPCRWDRIAERLADRGYRQVVAKRLDDGALPVVKAHVPGLGSLTRSRRWPQ
jgi:ribosomal protein S12 methylthiotransferase accessory factor YcaO